MMSMLLMLLCCFYHPYSFVVMMMVMRKTWIQIVPRRVVRIVVDARNGVAVPSWRRHPRSTVVDAFDDSETATALSSLL
jgi:hypothetical protein